MTIKRSVLVLLEQLDLIGINDRIIDAIWFHETSQVAQIDPLRLPVVWIVAAKRIDREQADHLPVVPSFDSVLEGFEKNRIIHWQPLDEGEWDASTIGKNECLVRQLFDRNWTIEALGVPKGRRAALLWKYIPSTP